VNVTINEVCFDRSIKWHEENFYAERLHSGGGATQDQDEDDPDENHRTTKETRKNILKAIIEEGFQGELHDELEKEFIKKKQFKVFTLAKKSDLESKFNGEAIGSISHWEPGDEKHMLGIIRFELNI
jgi:hypothetical protein